MQNCFYFNFSAFAPSLWSILLPKGEAAPHNSGLLEMPEYLALPNCLVPRGAYAAMGLVTALKAHLTFKFNFVF